MPSTGVLMRLLEMKGDAESTDEVILPPGMTANWLRFADTRAEHLPMGPGGRVEVVSGRAGTFSRATKKTALPPKRPFVVRGGVWHRLANPSRHPLTVHVKLKPTWNPKRAYFRLDGREFRGDEVWFEVKTHVTDRIARAMYRLHDLSAKRGNVSCRLAPKTSSIETFHKGAKVTIKCVEGTGTILVNGSPRALKVDDSVVVKPGQHYQLQNTSARPFEVNQIHEPQWEPEDTFYVEAGAVLPGNQVWFEFVVPD